jgi:hypothetical protein
MANIFTWLADRNVREGSGRKVADWRERPPVPMSPVMNESKNEAKANSLGCEAIEPRSLTLVIVSGNPLYGYQAAHSLSLRYRRILFVFDRRYGGRRFGAAPFGPFWCAFAASPNIETELVATLRSLCRGYAPCVVVPADPAAMVAVNEARAQLDCAIFPIPETARVEEFDDKCAFNAFCVENGIDVPVAMTLAHKQTEPFEGLVARLGLPFVVKPTSKTGGEGYRLIRSSQDFDVGVRCDDAYGYSPLAAQELVEGEDVDISDLAGAGEILHIAVQRNSGGTVTFIHDETAVAMARKLVRVSNFSGLLHLDGRRDPHGGKIMLVEANPRGWGSMKAATWCGLDFISAGVAVALGQKSTQPVSIEAGSYPGFPRLLAELAAEPRRWSRLDSRQRGLILTRLTAASYIASRLMTVLQRAWGCLRAPRARVAKAPP